MGSTQGYTLPAPAGGLNLIAPIDRVPETDALDLVNLYPKGQRVALRNGIATHCATGQAAAVRSLFALPLKNGTTKLVAAVNDTLQEVSSGTASAITGTTTPSSDDWNGAVFAHRLFMCNGVDTPQVYTGTGNAADINFTGPTLANLINVSSYKERLYFVQKESGSFWYDASVGGKAVGGGAALTEYPLDYFMREGGQLLFAGSYTDRLESVTSDLFMAATSEGELLFYAGSYPGGSWSLQARYKIGRPLSYNSFIRVGSDVWILTDEGITPVSMLFSGGIVGENTIGGKINDLIRAYASAIGFDHRWGGCYWSAGKRVYIRVPSSSASQRLLVCNVETGAWTKYEYGIDGACTSMAIADGIPYYGSGAGVVHEAETGYADVSDPIRFKAKLPFSFFGARGNFKTFKDIRPLMYTLGGVTLTVGVDTDFRVQPTSATISTAETTITEWDVAEWDTAEWADEAAYVYDRYSIEGQGHSAALKIDGSLKDSPLEFSAFEIRYEIGSQV